MLPNWPLCSWISVYVCVYVCALKTVHLTVHRASASCWTLPSGLLPFGPDTPAGNPSGVELAITKVRMPELMAWPIYPQYWGYYTLSQPWLSILSLEKWKLCRLMPLIYIIFNLISMAVTILIIFHIEGKFQLFDNSSQSVEKSYNYFQLQNCTATNVELHQQQHHHNWSTINPLFFTFPCPSCGVVEAQKRIAAKRQLTDPGN